MKLASNLELEGGAVISSWDFLSCNWSAAPAQVGTATVSTQPGAVYAYTLGAVTRYRFVPNTYSPALDAFYATYSGGLLGGLITSRG